MDKDLEIKNNISFTLGLPILIKDMITDNLKNASNQTVIMEVIENNRIMIMKMTCRKINLN